MIRFILNEKMICTDLPPGMVLLDFIRYHQHLMGTKIGCREGDCGACTVLIGEIKNGELHYLSMTSCLVPLGNVQNKHIVTIEGVNLPAIAKNAPVLNPIQQAIADEGATQCGFCTPGFAISLAGFCLGNKEATKENAIAAVDGNICRCTGYKSIERAAGKVAELMKERNGAEATQFVAKKKILPDYFASIKKKMISLENGQLSVHPSSLTLRMAGGGTDLYVQQPEDLKNATMHFLFDNPGLKGIAIEGNKVNIGASATVTDLKDSPVFNNIFPSFRHYARLISSTPIRNMATLAGNFINASPIGDFTIFFLALDAQLILSDGQSKRQMPLRKLYKSYKTLNKKPEEFIERIWFLLPAENSFFHFEKVSKRTHLDIASVNSALSLIINGNIIESGSISAGGVGPVPMHLEKTSAFLRDKIISDLFISELINIAQSEISPISDARGCQEYKRLLLAQLIKAHFITLQESKINHQDKL